MPQQYKVPQNIDLEDKIVGPFTMKQFAYLMGSGLLIYAIYQVFTPYENGVIYTVVLSLPLALLALALTFIKINDRPFEYFIVNFFQFAFSPKKRIWQRGYEAPIIVIKTPVRQKVSTATDAQKRASLDEIATSLELSAGNTGPGATQAPKPGANAENQPPGVQGYTQPAVQVSGQESVANGKPANQPATAPPPPAPPQNPNILQKVFDITKK